MISAVNHDSYEVRRSWNLRPVRKIAHWLQLRSALYICFRLMALLHGYSITASRAKKRALGAVRLEFRCSERATVLMRHMDPREPTQVWDGAYRVLDGRTLRLTSPAERPSVGVATDTPSALVAFLRDQGYIVETGCEASSCATYLGSTELARLENHVRLIEFIESSPSPLVRFWRWPSNARSALCLTGDLDALSLTDYAARAFAL